MAIKMPHAVKPPANIERKAEAFISGAGTKPRVEDDAGKVVVNMRFDSALLKRIDEAAKRQGISRTAWLHVAAANALE
jgi:hypothetical protein